MLSFVIPAHHEELLIARTLVALSEAGAALGEPFEIVVADDASTDRTAAIAREHGARVVPVQHRQIAATRNAGARAATGEWLVFVDGLLARLLLSGERGLRTREGKELGYAERRPDPERRA